MTGAREGCNLVSVADVLDAVCHTHRVRSVELWGERRFKRLVYLRRLALLVCRQYGFTLPEVAAALGRDHSSLVSLQRGPCEQNDINRIAALARGVAYKRLSDFAATLDVALPELKELPHDQ